MPSSSPPQTGFTFDLYTSPGAPVRAGRLTIPTLEQAVDNVLAWLASDSLGFVPVDAGAVEATDAAFDELEAAQAFAAAMGCE
jgi:hypothetical protein